MGLACVAAGSAVAAGEADADVITSGVVDQTFSTIATPFDLDLNSDSVIDYTFIATSTSKGDFLRVQSQNDNRFLTLGGKLPVRLSADELIDNSRSFGASGSLSTSIGAANWEAPFPTSGFMGVRLSTTDKGTGITSEFFGWIEITATSDSEAVVNQWAFEDQAGVGILAGSTTSLATAAVPEPSTAAFLAAAGMGYLARRFLRNRKAATVHEDN